jgi:GT2 family glycosyltransferase
VWNEIIQDSAAEYICLLNNDTRVEAGWLSKLLECFEDDERLGVVGPMTNASTGPQGVQGKRTTHKNLLKTVYPPVGFCLLFPRHIWEEVSGFDEEYEIYGEDSNFCMEVRELRYNWLIRTDVFIYHHGKSSTPIALARGKDIIAQKKRSKDRFIAKWKSGELRPVQRELKEEREAVAAARAAERAAKNGGKNKL